MSTSIVRSYLAESTGSHPNSEVKQLWACTVLRWGTTRESQVTHVFDSDIPDDVVSIPHQCWGFDPAAFCIHDGCRRGFRSRTSVIHITALSGVDPTKVVVPTGGFHEVSIPYCGGGVDGAL